MFHSTLFFLQGIPTEPLAFLGVVGIPLFLILFVFLIVFLFPILSVALVSGYGFIVWIVQMIFGPPGPA